MLNSILGASWKPKVIAILAMFPLIAGLITAMIDGDPKTVPDVTDIVTQSLLVWALFQTRQNSVTSEQVKFAAKK